MSDSFDGMIAELLASAEQYELCMSLEVCQDGKSVSLYLDTARSTVSEWIPGEGADISLMRCQETGKVVGVRLPLYRNNLAVYHDGPLQINDGFRKEG